jgi:pimeloyl-ACP methyl ester carboxylesterase
VRRVWLIFTIAAGALLIAILASVGGGSTSTGDAGTPSPAHGSFQGQIPIGGGRKLYLRCAGTGGPTVILESGIHDSSDTWTLTDTEPPVVPSLSVFAGVSRYTHVCMYDRPGTIRYTNPAAITTRSTAVKMPRTLQSMVSDLRSLLRRAGVPGPYVFVGHSFGGLIVRLFAQTYPSEIAGLVFVDAFGTNIRRLFGPRLWPRYVQLLNYPGIPLDKQPGFETVDIDGAIKAVQDARPLPRVPLAVISKTEPFATAPGTPKDLTAKLEEVWHAVQKALVTLEPQTPQVLATGSDHYVQIRDPDLTISIIELILDRVRYQERRGTMP